MINSFELHLGFPTDAESVAASSAALETLRDEDRGWTYSEVRNVFVKNPGCFDPHNVPGTLGGLISREISVWDEVTIGSAIDGEVIRNAERALGLLRDNRSGHARLEIEYPFGCLEAKWKDGNIIRSVLVGDPISIPDDKLRLKGGTRLQHTPEWEIHFVVEKRIAKPPAILTIQDVPAVIEAHGMDIEQTIEYRSQTMRERGFDDYKFIATAYFANAEETETEGRRIFPELARDFGERGYSVKLILEHIVACYRPTLDAEGAVATSDFSGELIHAH